MEYKEISIYDEKLRNFEEKVIRIIEIDKFLKKRCKKKSINSIQIETE